MRGRSGALQPRPPRRRTLRAIARRAAPRRALPLALLLASALATAAALAAQRPAAPPPPNPSRTPLAPGRSAIVGATVIPMTGDVVLRDATVLVQDGRVVAVGPRSAVTVPAGTRTIDGRGRWVIPGFADMHTHLYADEYLPDSVAPAELGVMLAHGVTAARLMIGTPAQRRLREQVAQGRVDGPQLWLASPQLSGDEAANTWIVRTEADARRAVRMARDSSYDFIKLTTNLSRPVYDAIVSEARELRLRVTGHVDPRVGVARALEAGQQIEHLDNYMESVLADSAPTRVSVSDVGAYRVANWATLDHVDNAKVEAIAGATARAGVAVTPTLAFFRLWFATPFTDAQVRARPDFAFIPPSMRAPYERSRTRYWQSPPDSLRRARYIAVRNRMVKAIVDSGGRIMAGSDAPGGLMVYGWTLHRELAMLVDAGLTPMQALAAATRVPAEWLGAATEWGSIAPGRRADLVVLEADPLADIHHTSRIAAVAIGGRWHDRAALDSMITRAQPMLGG